ncbi:MAG: putative acyltransferase [Acidimicrobiaceae bacterium]|nr:putative acyltransferase [Acidimicrobiaceae bacterium]
MSPSRTLRVLRPAGILALLGILIFSAPTSFSGASAAPAGPTLAQLISYVTASSKLKQGPNVSSSLPPLTQAANDGAAAMIPSPCVSSSPALVAIPTNAGTTCAFGDKEATRTILLFGDSQASTWLPAFNIAGEMLQWKVVFLAKDGCGPWISPVTSAQGSSACSQWVHGEISVAKQLRPQVVIPVGLTLSQLSDKEYPSTTQFAGEVLSMVQGLAPSHAKVLFLQEIPQFYSYFTSATPESCLTVHSSSIQNCELTIKQIKAIETTVGLNEVATIDHLETVPIRELFCGKVRCDVFVKSPGESHLVYQDWAHMNATYSAWIGRATAQLLEKYLPT